MAGIEKPVGVYYLRTRFSVRRLKRKVLLKAAERTPDETPKKTDLASFQ
jgi:hypothetical protein